MELKIKDKGKQKFIVEIDVREKWDEKREIVNIDKEKYEERKI
jgi:hypothetical protein